MYVPLSDREFLWNQFVDTVDDYFTIEREERVRLVGGVLTEGQIDTFPQPGATMLEPWHKDSSPGFERRYATLQSIRRRAVVHVKPQVDGGYLVDLAVYKELEDVSQPEFSTVNVEPLRHDGTLLRPGGGPQADPRRWAGSPWAETRCWNSACWPICAAAGRRRQGDGASKWTADRPREPVSGLPSAGRRGRWRFDAPSWPPAA